MAMILCPADTRRNDNAAINDDVIFASRVRGVNLVILMPNKVWDEITIHPPNLAMLPFKFGNGYVISFHTYKGYGCQNDDRNDDRHIFP